MWVSEMRFENVFCHSKDWTRTSWFDIQHSKMCYSLAKIWKVKVKTEEIDEKKALEKQGSLIYIRLSEAWERKIKVLSKNLKA